MLISACRHLAVLYKQIVAQWVNYLTLLMYFKNSNEEIMFFFGGGHYFNKITTINLTENLWNCSPKFTAVLKSSEVKVPKINTSSSRFVLLNYIAKFTFLQLKEKYLSRQYRCTIKKTKQKTLLPKLSRMKGMCNWI